MLIIGMSGTGGVGKTTVLNAIKNKYPNLKQPVSSARFVMAQRGITEADQRTMEPDALLELQEQITGHWWNQFNGLKHEPSVWDRTMLDHYAYGMVRNHKSVSKDWINLKRNQTISNLNHYTHLFYFPQPETWEPKSDPIRDPAPGTRKLVDLVMLGFLHEQGYHFHMVPTDSSPETVIEFVLERLK